MSQERPYQVASGWARLPINLGMVIAAPVLFFSGVGLAAGAQNPIAGVPLIILGLLSLLVGILLLAGHFTLQPNEARVLILFGEYKGTVRESGFFWTNPFMSKL